MYYSKPLVVDLDGTLIRADILVEGMLGQFKKSKTALFELPFWFFMGKTVLKTKLARHVELDIASLPYNKELITFLEQERKNNRQIVLATASHRFYADQIASHLGIFDRVIATEGNINLSSNAKRERLVAEFGHKGFDYMGNSREDLAVWTADDKAYLVDPDPGVSKLAEKNGNVERIIISRPNLLHAFFRSLRPYQWLKNLLIFIPLLAAHQVMNGLLFFQALFAFIFFCATASSGYLVNDLLDLENDRYHHRKKSRPLASGDLPIHIGLLTAPILFIAAFVFSLVFLSWHFTLALTLYYVITIAYSHFLKGLMGIDTIVLAFLYTLRIIAGSYACGLVPTFWILAFSMFIFLSLAMLKRYSELFDARAKGETSRTKGRGYFPSDIEIIANLGISSGYLSVLVLALYIQDSRTLLMYKTHELIWLACPILLFWISRVWIIAHRGEMDDDPVLFAIKDKVSLMTGALFAFVFVLAMIV